MDSPREGVNRKNNAEEGKPPASLLDRRSFVRVAGLVGAGVAATAAVAVSSRVLAAPADPSGPTTARELPSLGGILESETEDQLLRMQRELARAMAKPAEQRRWEMVIDSKKCVGCHACTISCIAENKLPPGVVYRPVIQEELGSFPNVQLRFTPRPCMQCDTPPCTPVCPVKATWKRVDGVVVVDYDRCIGCRYCLTACPYGARTGDFGHYYSDDTPAMQPYEDLPNHEYGKLWNRAGKGSPVGNARKCHFCLHRLEKGLLPQCVTTCVGRANYFGDANDPSSLVSQKAVAPNSVKLLEERGTNPKVVYLI